MGALWRIIDTGALDSFTNMAFDEAILRCYERHSSPPTLRVYGWSRPSLSLGYSQDPERELDVELCRKTSVPFVRRITGGGIILHGNELTYSLVCSKEDLGIPRQVVSSYKIISSFLVAFYNALGLKAEFACDASLCEAFGRPSALCFASKEKYDIVSGGKKLGGSAQKRLKGVVFQHGSIPYNFNKGRASSFSWIKDASADERATCLEDILGHGVNSSELSQLLIRSFVKSFNIEAETSGLSETEERAFAKLKALKYESADWNINRIDRVSEDSKKGTPIFCGSSYEKMSVPFQR